MKRKIYTILIVLIFLIGLLIMLYPTISSWYNEQVSSYAVSTYQGAISDELTEDADEILKDARAYNEKLHQTEQRFVKGAASNDAYKSTLNVSDGMMGYIKINKIDVSLPIYHGTDETVLQKGIGHLEGSSLPIGDEGEHAVFTGHTGLPSSTLFTNLNQLVVGDRFQISVLDKNYTYEIKEILVVEPDETDTLLWQEGKDLVTLITCTPYGVNSHRLLVHGERVADEYSEIDVQSEVDMYAVKEVLPMVGVILAVAILIRILVKRRKKKR